MYHTSIPGAFLMGFLPQLSPQTTHAVPHPPAQRTPQPGHGLFLLLGMRDGKTLAGGIFEVVELTPALSQYMELKYHRKMLRQRQRQRQQRQRAKKGCCMTGIVAIARVSLRGSKQGKCSKGRVRYGWKERKHRKQSIQESR